VWRAPHDDGELSHPTPTSLLSPARWRAQVIQYNVIPTEAWAGFDVRIPCTVDLEAFKAQVDAWCSERCVGTVGRACVGKRVRRRHPPNPPPPARSEGVTWELVKGTGDGALANPTTAVTPDSHWWAAFTAAAAAADAPLHPPSVFPAASDGRWIRMALGTPCLGFSPMRGMPVLLHDHDEYVTLEGVEEGVLVYERLIPALANTPPQPGVEGVT
jgi:aminoacylase